MVHEFSVIIIFQLGPFTFFLISGCSNVSSIGQVSNRSLVATRNIRVLVQQSIVHPLSQVLNGELEEVQIYNALTQALNFSRV